MKDIKVFLVVLVIGLSILVVGCNNDPAMQHDTKGMGPMPTAMPQGSPYAAQSKSNLTPDQFISKLQTLPANQRRAFMNQNQSVIVSIMSGQDENMKKKLQNTPVQN